MSEILVAMIIKMCIGDAALYYVQGYSQDCHHYIINCTLNKQDHLTERAIRECSNDKHKAIKPVQ